MKITSSKTILFLLLGLGSALVAWGGYFMFYGKIMKQSARADETTLRITELKQEQDRIIDIKRAVERTTDDREFLESHFYSTESLPLLLETIEEYATTAGALVEIATLDETDKGLRILIKSYGSFSSIMNFVSLLEYGPFEVKLDRMMIRRVPDGLAPVPIAGQTSSPTSTSVNPVWEMNTAIDLFTYTKKTP